MQIPPPPPPPPNKKILINKPYYGIGEKSEYRNRGQTWYKSKNGVNAMDYFEDTAAILISIV